MLYESKWAVEWLMMVFMGNFIAFVTCTGLNVEFDRILEIACIVTDGSLTKSVEVFYPSSIDSLVPQNYWLVHYVLVVRFY